MISIAIIAIALGGKRCGTSFSCRCPAHHDRKPSLSLSQTSGGKILAHCHAGCSQHAVIDALKARGLWPAQPLKPEPRPNGSDNPDHRQLARRIFLQAEPLRGKAGGIYLVTRGLAVPATPRLKHHPALWHSAAREHFPGLVAAHTDADDRFCGITRIFLSKDHRGCVCKAPVELQKRALGAIRGAAIRLADAAEDCPLIIAEGIETALACMESTGWPAWASGGAANLIALELPPSIRDVIIAADPDEPGELGAQKAARRFMREGRKVRVARSSKPGMDFCDVLNAPKEGAAA
jgi:putative DNA primase/helicase